jgi:osmoprotectant transport system substrate-binding protein
MRMRARWFTPLAAVAALTLAACGEAGSSGDAAGGSSAAGSASGDACAPVSGEQLVVLEDDKQLQNADNIIPAVNAAANTSPALLQALDAVSAALTTEDLIEMNAAVDVQRESAEEVAKRFVADAGLAGGVTGGSGPLVVGGSNFTESTILANIYAEVLTAAGFEASVQEVGNREVYLPALQSGQIQVFPEYLSTVTDFINKQADVNGPDAPSVASGDVDATVAALTPLAQQVGLVFGTPSEAADQNAFAVTEELADSLGVTTLSELAEACGDGSLVLGGPAECPERPQCQPGLEETYGMSFASFSQLDAGGPLTKAGIQQGKVSIGLVFSSDGALARG